jgi:hypothetical protein
MQFMIVTETRDLDRSLAAALAFNAIAGTNRELATTLLVEVAGPNRSKAPATILMLNRV